MVEVLDVDWSGEEYDGRLAAFVTERLRALGVDADLDTAAVYADPGARGELVPRLLDQLAGQVAAHGRTLAVREDGDDAYHVLVLDAGEPASPPVRAWGDPGAAGGATLISLDCPHCGSMQVWELPAGETLAGEGCDCGEPLFDTDAQPLPGVVLHT